MPQLPKCKVCETRRWTKRVRGDYFRCTNCGSIWESKGFSEQERRARFCPVCDTYVEYDNWHEYENYSPWDKGKLKNFHYECYDKHHTKIMEYREWLEKEIIRAEAIGQIECPNCNTQNICVLPEDSSYHDLDIIYMCLQCDTIYSEEWINGKIKETEPVK